MNRQTKAQDKVNRPEALAPLCIQCIKRIVYIQLHLEQV
jgi:hypothetical protein